ncbi:hypothetical protein [Azotobacter armeniacus]
MIITLFLFILLACYGLFVAGLCVGRWMRPSSGSKTNIENVTDDVSLFYGWDGLTPVERKKRLGLYQRRVLARSAEQERAWLQARLRECTKDRNAQPHTARDF